MPSKQEVRERVWRLLEERNAALPPRPVRGRIPNFVGAAAAALRLFSTPEWEGARVVKVNPDSPQRPVREGALRQGKTLVMPTPRIRRGFVVLDPSRLDERLIPYASTIKGALSLGRVVEPSDLPDIDLVVQGSVAVNKRGLRLGKGEGYAEIEWGIARELGKVREETPVATTVHDLQLVEDEWEARPYDLRVDIIATPTRLVRVGPGPPKPPGVLWGLLDPRKLDEIPVLRRLAPRGRG